MRPPSQISPACARVLLFIWGASLSPFHSVVLGAPNSTLPMTRVSEVNRLKAFPEIQLTPVRLEATLYFISSARDWLVLGDDEGFVDFEMDRQADTLRVGDRVRIEGIAELGGLRSRLRKRPLIDNDGLHDRRTEKGSLELKAGLHSFELQYFQLSGEDILELRWKGPGFGQQPADASCFFQRAGGDWTPPHDLVPGLNYLGYFGQWQSLPRFEELKPAKFGTTTNLTSQILGTNWNFALQFTCWLKVTNDGTYYFELSSDDGSRLFIDPSEPSVRRLGPGTLRPARWDDTESRDTPGHSDDYVELECTPEFGGGGEGGLRLQAQRRGHPFEILFSSDTYWHPTLLANSRLRVRGVLQGKPESTGDHGVRLLVDAQNGVTRLDPVPAIWRMTPNSQIKSLASWRGTSPLVHTSGRVVRQTSETFVLVDDGSELTVHTGQPLSTPPGVGQEVEVLGRLQPAGEKLALAGAIWRPLSAPNVSPDLILTNLDQVHRLSRAQIGQGRPLKVTATVVLSQRPWLFVRDLFRTIYVSDWPAQPPRVGEVYGLEGTTTIDKDSYTPFLYPDRVTFLGVSSLPEPLRPSWEQLTTGNFDAQWVELEGVASSVNTNSFVLSTGGGRLGVQILQGLLNAPELEGSLVRVRGCCSVDMSEKGRITRIQMLLQSPQFIYLTIPAPVDPFALQPRPVASLLAFDADATPLRYVKVIGTILQQEGSLFFLSDGMNGVRFVARRPEALDIGDRVEVVGLLDATTQVAVLRESWVKRLGQGPLPPPILPKPKELSTGAWDATLVRVEGLLLNVTTNPVGQLLEMEIDDRITPVRLNANRGFIPNLQPGSWLEVTGVCNGRYSDDVSAKELDSFELLLGAPGAVRVISTPSWWTARHALSVLGGLGIVVLLAGGWITSLRQQVEQRTRQLQLEIAQHEETESKLENEIAERKRIELEVETAHKALLAASRQAGMAEVASSVLHNVGNVLNSVTVSTSLLADRMKRFRLGNLSKAVGLLRENETRLGNFLTDDPRGKQLPAYLGKISDHLATEQALALEEINHLGKSVAHITSIVVMQQNYATAAGVLERVDLAEVFEDALRMNADALSVPGLQVYREYDPSLPPFLVDRHKVLQILVNLVRNAAYACEESGRVDGRITVRLLMETGKAKLVVLDNGVGIASENLTRVFNQGFTTRKRGHGYGLHSGALSARELGGSLNCYSEGPGLGAVFTLELPLTTPREVIRPQSRPEV